MISGGGRKAPMDTMTSFSKSTSTRVYKGKPGGGFPKGPKPMMGGKKMKDRPSQNMKFGNQRMDDKPTHPTVKLKVTSTDND